MNKESVGKLFNGNFGIYECVAYSDKPSVVMKNTITNECICVSIDSNYAKTFELIEEDKKIEKLELVSNGNGYALLNEYGTKCGLTKHSKIMCDKINEIIDYINGGTNGK